MELKTAGRDGTTAVFLSPANVTARMAALIPLPGKPTNRHWLGSAPLVQLGAFTLNAKLRPLVVQAGALAPRRRDKPQAAGHDCQVALTDEELAHHMTQGGAVSDGAPRDKAASPEATGLLCTGPASQRRVTSSM